MKKHQKEKLLTLADLPLLHHQATFSLPDERKAAKKTLLRLLSRYNLNYHDLEEKDAPIMRNFRPRNKREIRILERVVKIVVGKSLFVFQEYGVKGVYIHMKNLQFRRADELFELHRMIFHKKASTALDKLVESYLTKLEADAGEVFGIGGRANG